MFARIVLGLILGLTCFSQTFADLVLYNVPGTNLVFILQGRATVNPGATVTFRHPTFGNLYMNAGDVKIYKVPSVQSLAVNKLTKAKSDQDLNGCLDAARNALKIGKLDLFYQSCKFAWEIDPNDDRVKRLVDLKLRINKPVEIDPAQEKIMRDFTKNRADMKFIRSKHFLLLHDTGNKKDRRTSKTRAEERLELLETVYESFLMKFCLEGVELEVPDKLLMVVLFAEHSEYLQFVNLLGPDLASAAGFFHRVDNVAVFYDQGTDQSFEVLNLLNRKIQNERDEIVRRKIPGMADIIRFADTLNLLIDVKRENLDIEVVSHEATHQLAANTGLMPADSPIPLWAAEGLATYFESPKQAAWSGIGAVNSERLEWYRELAPLRKISNINFIVSDQIFTRSANNFTTLHAYGQSWALTHFLMEKHFAKLVAYYQELGKLPKASHAKPDELQKVFDKVFGDNKDILEGEWRAYMRSLKTDLEKTLDDAR
ncbi:DUF1570 domain-containing protein [Bremerella cremea]|uniref:DUF1570 domain-containing protein n=1 Tax=Blastopirellula marina TaxID=124 RepID=A0A2S8FVJ4_9BACT|nr:MULTISPECIES: DUF1570 domain-containing protein [Pirellulaceae]PQO36211.1 hypothetical protein C5Y83_09860 [Blastopirellula marina]RCS48888.1 DUF1570 domain-containing protein [Bremerella cremea]